MPILNASWYAFRRFVREWNGSEVSWVTYQHRPSRFTNLSVKYIRTYRDRDAVRSPRDLSGALYTPNTGHTFGVPNQFVATPPTAIPPFVVMPRCQDSILLKARRDQRYRCSYEALKTAFSHSERMPRESVVHALETAAAYMASIVAEAKGKIEELRAQLDDGADLDRQTVAHIKKERWMVERRCSRLEGDERLVEEKVHTLKADPHALLAHRSSSTSRESRRRKNLSMFFERSPTKVFTSCPRLLQPIRVDDTSRIRTVKNLSSPTRLRPQSPRTLWKSYPLPNLVASPKSSATARLPPDETVKTRPPSRRWTRQGNVTRGRSVTASTASESVFSAWDEDCFSRDSRSGTALVYRPLKLSESSVMHKLSDAFAAVKYPNQDSVGIPGYVWDLLDDFEMVGEEITFAFDPELPPSPTLPQFARPLGRRHYFEAQYPVTPSEPHYPLTRAEALTAQPASPPPPTRGHSRRRTTAFSLTRWTSSSSPSSPAPSSHSRPPSTLHLHIESPKAVRRRSQSHPLPLSSNMLYAIPESPNPGLSPPPISASVRSQRSNWSHRLHAKSLFRLGHAEPSGLSPSAHSGSQETLFIQATSPDRDPFSATTPSPSPYSIRSAQDVPHSSGERERSTSEPFRRRDSMVARLKKRLHVFK
ncbi:hypothetical protein NEOLEDRAFT_1151344 [Neolentinus lepideus HHB14362 ss-1]|uniref:Uncharacterized protein n=1 Tax=Neolentinus lepideus HHB14362 ss-1 TaxID=1314782 RepID=A0A165P3J2_9AGAM|nr:hypothetical protein NEOLEDRAFT_1151344 [Neolentinus lepideus HHB14362 ss-1]